MEGSALYVEVDAGDKGTVGVEFLCQALLLDLLVQCLYFF